MREYTIFLNSTATFSRTVEAESYGEAVEKVYDEYGTPVPCHQEEYSLGDWEPDNEASDPDYAENIAKARTAFMDRVVALLRDNRDLAGDDLAALLADKGVLNMPK